MSEMDPQGEKVRITIGDHKSWKEPEALGERATARPWRVNDLIASKVQALAVGADGTYAYPDQHGNREFVLYAVNHIEQAEAALAEALALLRDLAWDSFTLASRRDRIRAFLDRHPQEAPDDR